MAAAKWQNWSGSVSCQPTQIAYPESVAAVQKLVRAVAEDKQVVRVVGSGHSFTPLADCDGMLVSLDHLQGLVSIDKAAASVTVYAGTKLQYLGELLRENGWAQANLGDIDQQSIAGAISTGTHGTGITLGSLSTQVCAMSIVNGVGEIVDIRAEDDGDLLNAARVSLGALGIIVTVTLQVLPAYSLHYQSRREELGVVLENLETYKQENRHFEFYWFPFSEAVQTKFLNMTEAVPTPVSMWSKFNKIVVENWAFWLLSESCRLFPGMTQWASRFSGKAIGQLDEINYSNRVFATPRLVRFQEMEYNIPAEYFTTVMQKIKACIEERQFKVHFPLECRFVHADNIWLSPAYQRESAYIAIHMYRGMPYLEYFNALEEIFVEYEGRPHWGKMHSLGADALSQRYPQWQQFLELRHRMDPDGRFLNRYLRNLFGL